MKIAEVESTQRDLLSRDRLQKSLTEAAAKITSDMFSDIANMYASGDSVPTIAKKYNVDRKTISYHLKRLPNYDEIYVEHWKNAQYSPTYPANFTPQQIKQMAELYSSGAKLVDIARKFGVTPDNASLMIRRHYPEVYNIAREPGAPGYSKGVTADMIQRMKYLRDSGMSYRDIGKKFSLDHKTVMHHLRKIDDSST
jgi:DNA-binding CsgD family transcriptional regulator